VYEENQQNNQQPKKWEPLLNPLDAPMPEGLTDKQRAEWDKYSKISPEEAAKQLALLRHQMEHGQ